MSASEEIGSAGVALLLLAFLLNLFGLMRTGGIVYQLLNFIGAAIACYASVLIDFRPFVVLEATWSLAALAGLIKTVAAGGGTRVAIR
ncbi:MAG: CBU_0592 family membrane protein [Candidatus Binataceae bacterium]